MPEPEPTPAPVVRRSRWQFGLRAMLAVTALVAVWTAHLNNLREIRRLDERIDALRPLVPELEVVDPSQLAFVRLEALWYDDNRWDVAVPEGAYRIRLATREVEEAGFPTAAAWARLPAGRRRVELRQVESTDGWRITVVVDGTPLVEAVEPKSWGPSAGTSTNESGGGIGSQVPFGFRRRFLIPKDDGTSFLPQGPGNGILMWIERYDPEAPGPGGDSSKTPTGRDASPSPTSYLK